MSDNRIAVIQVGGSEEGHKILMAHGFRKERMSDNRIAVIQVGGPEEDQKVLRAHGSPQGVVRNVTAALSIVTNLQDNGGKRRFEGLTEGS